MPATCVIGLQWGDEAKGKIVDLLTQRNEIVVRYQGGSNAGHTVVAGNQTYKLSLVPSGILRTGVQCVITGGVVIHPQRLLQEMENLRAQGIEIGRNLMISDRAHVIFPWHLAEEKVLESRADGEAIGTTMRGIGTCYRDKAGRSQAIRLGDLYREQFAKQVERIVAEKNPSLAALDKSGDFQPLDAAKILAEYRAYADRLQPHVCDTTDYLLGAAEADQKILMEGAQGALLDVDHGTYPFVTSSNSSGAGISNGSGLPGRYVKKIIGIVKAYTTRVGGGPFPTEELGDIGQEIRTRGREYGTVTGRPRRCGWFDAVAARYTARLSGVDILSVMLLDVLDTQPELKICTHYEINGTVTQRFPSHVEDLAKAKPVFETLPGWQSDTTGARSYADLPDNAKKYLTRLSEVIGRPVKIVSIGPDRAQTIFLDGVESI